MTKAELFGHITRVITSPHTAITEHDKRIAIHVFLCFHEYLSEIRGFDAFEDEIDLGGYAAKIIDELEGK